MKKSILFIAFLFLVCLPPINSFDGEAYGQGAHKYYIDYEDGIYFIQTEMDGGWEIDTESYRGPLKKGDGGTYRFVRDKEGVCISTSKHGKFLIDMEWEEAVNREIERSNEKLGKLIQEDNERVERQKRLEAKWADRAADRKLSEERSKRQVEHERQTHKKQMEHEREMLKRQPIPIAIVP